MPHIHIEATPGIIDSIEWPTVLERLHTELADQGWARLADLKSRVQPSHRAIAGHDTAAQQVVATLTLTNPRPQAMRQAMSDAVLRHLSQAINEIAPTQWVQCCVFLQQYPREEYLKQQWNSPPLA